MRPDEIGLLSGEDRPTGDEPIIIAVINSARRFPEACSKDRKVFLVVDECHRAGSPGNAKAPQGTFVATLGLSATPEREYDEGFQTFIAPVLRPVIYEYTYRDAANDGVISPFSLTNVHVETLPDEEEKYRRLTRRIALAMRSARQDEAPQDDHLNRADQGAGQHHRLRDSA